eukprot:MONOS_693.1-p1 / transcript=MONOS_693.1 / gene=MONOS_693 / organism=Monocercomonoides_exilis_PA203 / gene_product=unspecified product / transcript_product=unspecified product / location=Mono_scaffold00011:213057-215475(+) / protein_length=708 / sequence_SO=supercontig / SO=protein_coding / is_pseudo=false
MSNSPHYGHSHIFQNPREVISTDDFATFFSFIPGRSLLRENNLHKTFLSFLSVKKLNSAQFLEMNYHLSVRKDQHLRTNGDKNSTNNSDGPIRDQSKQQHILHFVQTLTAVVDVGEESLRFNASLLHNPFSTTDTHVYLDLSLLSCAHGQESEAMEEENREKIRNYSNDDKENEGKAATENQNTISCLKHLCKTPGECERISSLAEINPFSLIHPVEASQGDHSENKDKTASGAKLLYSLIDIPVGANSTHTSSASQQDHPFFSNNTHFISLRDLPTESQVPLHLQSPSLPLVARRFLTGKPTGQEMQVVHSFTNTKAHFIQEHFKQNSLKGMKEDRSSSYESKHTSQKTSGNYVFSNSISSFRNETAENEDEALHFVYVAEYPKFMDLFLHRSECVLIKHNSSSPNRLRQTLQVNWTHGTQVNCDEYIRVAYGQPDEKDLSFFRTKTNKQNQSLLKLAHTRHTQKLHHLHSATQQPSSSSSPPPPSPSSSSSASHHSSTSASAPVSALPFSLDESLPSSTIHSHPPNTTAFPQKPLPLKLHVALPPSSTLLFSVPFRKGGIKCKDLPYDPYRGVDVPRGEIWLADDGSYYSKLLQLQNDMQTESIREALDRFHSTSLDSTSTEHSDSLQPQKLFRIVDDALLVFNMPCDQPMYYNVPIIVSCILSLLFGAFLGALQTTDPNAKFAERRPLKERIRCWIDSKKKKKTE